MIEPGHAPLIVPIIHLNGDRAETLITALDNAYDALHSALETLSRCAPNARNFYPVPGLFAQAVLQHQRRILALATVLQSLEAEAMAIQTPAGSTAAARSTLSKEQSMHVPDDEDFPIPDDEDHEDFADPGGRSALRAASAANPRHLPCPTCGQPNRLTPADQARHYHRPRKAPPFRAKI